MLQQPGLPPLQAHNSLDQLLIDGLKLLIPLLSNRIALLIMHSNANLLLLLLLRLQLCGDGGLFFFEREESGSVPLQAGAVNGALASVLVFELLDPLLLGAELRRGRQECQEEGDGPVVAAGDCGEDPGEEEAEEFGVIHGEGFSAAQGGLGLVGC